MDQLSGSFRLFQFAGINVYLHWSWLLVAFLQIKVRADKYSSPSWMVLEYLTLFGIVLTHEFGHALACRSVGGFADRIVLWPLGGVAYVAPPPRPGPTLWSIVAGPLVNVVLLVPTFALDSLSEQLDWADSYPDLAQYLYMIRLINTVLLIFNLIPIYPLDGGKILQTLLWFVVGEVKSLIIAGWIGVLGGLAFLVFAVYVRSYWFGIMAVFITLRAWEGIKYSRVLHDKLTAPRHDHLACPSCGESPPQGEHWKCPGCGILFDLVQNNGVCPRCGSQYEQIPCPSCFKRHPLVEWRKQAVQPEEVQPPV